jgi:hypothetical protein
MLEMREAELSKIKEVMDRIEALFGTIKGNLNPTLGEGCGGTCSGCSGCKGCTGCESTNSSGIVNNLGFNDIISILEDPKKFKELGPVIFNKEFLKERLPNKI